MPRLIAVFCLITSLFIFLSCDAFAQSRSTEIVARIQGPVATVSGIAAPSALITGKLEEFTLNSTVADEKGNFLLENLGIYKGADELCFNVSDINSYGISDSCTTFKPAEGDILLQDLFLSPTLGLAKNKIEVGESAILRGYSMPGAKVEVIMKNGEKKALDADPSGYFGTVFRNLKKGTYYFSASAKYKSRVSLLMKNEVKLEVGLEGAMIGTRAAGEKEIFLSPWLLLVIFLIALGFGLAIIITPRTSRGKLFILKLKKTKYYMQARSFLYKHHVLKEKQDTKAASNNPKILSPKSEDQKS